MDSLLPFADINETKGSITDRDIICNEANTLGDNHVAHAFWKSGKDLALPEGLNRGLALYPGACVKPKIAVYRKQVRECHGVTLISSPIKLRGQLKYGPLVLF